jgi:hypothetical protein
VLSISALRRQAVRSAKSVPPNQRARRNSTVSHRLINCWRQEYRAESWFDEWLLAGKKPPVNVTIATIDQIQRCRKAWDFVELCRRADISHQNTYDQEWIKKRKIPDVQWLLWLFGGPVPVRTFVVGAALHRLRSVMSTMRIAEAAGIDRRDVREWHKDSHLRAALEDAILRVGQTGDTDGRRTTFAQHWPDLPEDLIGRMWIYASEACLKACCCRAELTTTAYYKALQEAERCGVKDKLQDYLAHRGLFHRASGRGVDRRCGMMCDRFFIASPAMLAFREIATKEMSRQKIWSLMKLPGIMEWFRDWATPQQSYGTRSLLPFQTANAAVPASDLAPTPANPAMTHHDEEEGWSAPMSPTELARLFDVHYNTMITWLKNQTIRNQQVTPRRYRIGKEELPE